MMMNQGSPHILVVDDHSEIRDLLKRFLEQHGMRVSCARDGKEMKRLLDEREFDLLVLDLMMPGRMASPCAASSGSNPACRSSC
jgi:two-component system OmpR family response regulator